MTLSRYILDELARTLPRLNHRLNFTADDFQDLLDSLAILADLVEPDAGAEMPRDAKDQPILGTFIAAQADYLISGDKDLLALADAYAVVSPAQFWARHGR